MGFVCDDLEGRLRGGVRAPRNVKCCQLEMLLDWGDDDLLVTSGVEAWEKMCVSV